MKVFGYVLSNGQFSKLHISEYKDEYGTVYDGLKRRLVPKQGSVKTWHFALHPGECRYECDDDHYKSNKGPWHEAWQSYSPKDYIEVYYKGTRDGKEICHIADLVDKQNFIVEFQHSPIGSKDIRNREDFYGNMYWVVDATKASWLRLTDNRIMVKQGESWWEDFTKPLYLDLGMGLGSVCMKGSCSRTDRDEYKDDEKYFQSYYYICDLISYETFIKRSFYLKEPFILHPFHLPRTLTSVLPELPYHSVSDHQSVRIYCASRKTYDYRKMLCGFGFRWNEDFKRYQFDIYSTKGFSDAAMEFEKDLKWRNEKKDSCLFNIVQVKGLESYITASDTAALEKFKLAIQELDKYEQEIMKLPEVQMFNREIKYQKSKLYELDKKISKISYKMFAEINK